MFNVSSCEEAKRHSSGWAMRNTNNHNVSIVMMTIDNDDNDDNDDDGYDG